MPRYTPRMRREDHAGRNINLQGDRHRSDRLPHHYHSTNMTTILKHTQEHLDDDAVDIKGLSAAAKADAQEHQQTILEAFLIHKKAVFWSMALSAA